MAVVGVLALFVWRPWGTNEGADGQVDLRRTDGADVTAEATEAAPQPVDSTVVESASSGHAVTSAAIVAPVAPGSEQRAPAQVLDEVVFEVTCAGAPLKDARVVIAPVLRDPFWEGSNEGHSYEREQTAGVFVPFETAAEMQTDDAGRCVHALSALVELGKPLVVGVLHERAFGDVREIDIAALANSPVVAIDLEPAPACRAIVRGAEAGAEVRVQQSALYSDFREVDDFTNVFVSRPMLRFTHTRRGDGAVALFPVRGRNWVAARSGELIAAPFVGSLEGDIDVELAASFTVEGEVEGHPSTLLEGVVRVQARDRETGAWLDRGLGAIAADGTIADIGVAWHADATEWRVRADAVDLLPLEATFAPSPGGRFDVVLHAFVQTYHDVRVFDAVTQEVVPGARVVIDWNGRAEPTWEEFTDDTGTVKFNHLPVGTPWTFTVEHADYAPSGDIVYSADVAPVNRVLFLSLWPETVVVGAIVPPLDGAEQWRGEMKRLAPDRSNPLAVSIDARSGVFELRGLGGQHLSLFLENERGTIGPIDFDAAPGRVDLGRLEVVPFTSAEIRVLDAVSGGPIIGAAVAPHAPIADGTAAAQSESATTDDRGFARLVRFPSAGGWVSIEAPGYSTSMLDQFEWRDGIADFGEVYLPPDVRVVVELGERVATPERYSIGQVDVPHTRAKFDATGRAALATAAEAWHLELVDHQGRAERLRLLGDVGALGTEYVWPMRAGSLDVEVRNWPETVDGATPVMHELELAWREPLGTFERVLTVGPIGPFLPARALPVDSVRFSLSHPDGDVLAWGRADLPPVGDQKIVIDASVGATAMRVIDTEERPLAGIYVIAFDSSVANGFNVVGTTETADDGTVRIPMLERGELGISLLGPNDEIVQDVDTSGWRKGAVHDVLFAPSGELSFLVVARTGDESSALSAASIELRRGDDAFRLVGFDTDAAGRTPRTPAQPGTYVAVVAKAGYWSRRIAFDVSEGAASPVEILLPELTRLELRLVDSSGAPLANTAVELLHEGLDEFHSEWLAAGRVSGAAVTDLAGRLALDGVPAGTYVVGVGGYEVGSAATGAGVTTVVVR